MAEGFVRGVDEGDAVWWLGSLNLVKVGARDSQGGLSIVEHRVPAGYAPPPHVHRDTDEVFYVLDGQFAVTCGEEHWTAEPGSLVFLPRAVPHGFKVSADGPGRTLLIVAPGGFDELVRETGEAARSLTLPDRDAFVPDPDRIAEVSARYGIGPG